MNKPTYLGFSKTVIKQNCVIWMQIDSLPVYIKTDDIYKDIAENVETRFYTSNYELECNFIETL